MHKQVVEKEVVESSGTNADAVRLITADLWADARDEGGGTLSHSQSFSHRCDLEPNVARHLDEVSQSLFEAS